MTQEQKAKAYDEALEQAKKELNTCGSLDCDAARQIFRFFPQLKESEDERIRARLIEYFKGFLEGYEDCYKDGGCVKWEGLDVKSILAWLEKQKETADSFTDGIIEVRSFQRGMEEGRKLETQKEPGIKWLKSDNVKNPDKPYVDKAGMFYTTDGRMCYASEIEQQKEQKPVEYLSKDKVYTIMTKLTELSTSDLIPLNSDEYKKINEITSDVCSLLDYPIEQKPNIEICPHSIKSKSYKENGYPIENCDYGLEIALNILEKTLGKVQGFQTDDGIREHKTAIEAVRKAKEQKPAEWSDTDELVFKDICKHLKEEGFGGWVLVLNVLRNGEFQPKQEWSEEDSDNLERVDNYLWMLDDYVGDDCATPQGKVDKIRENIQKVLSPWLKFLPERFNLQPKQEWSEEDEEMLNSCISSIEESKENRYAYKETDGDTSYDHEIDWLKSLRPSWKPSEAQLMALHSVIDDESDTIGNEQLKLLYEQLKKLI